MLDEASTSFQSNGEPNVCIPGITLYLVRL